MANEYMHNTIHQGKKCECKENHHQLKTKAYEKQEFFFVLSMVFATTWMMPACSSGDESIPALPENTEKPSSNPSEELAESSFVAISFDYSDTKDTGLWQGGRHPVYRITHRGIQSPNWSSVFHGFGYHTA